MKSIIKFLENDQKKRRLHLCVSENGLIHILHYDCCRSICGKSSDALNCIISKELLITTFIEFIAGAIEEVNENFRPSFFWNSIDAASEPVDGQPYIQYKDIFSNTGELIYESGEYDIHVDSLNAAHVTMLYNSKFCKLCRGIFLEALFRSDEKNNIDILMDQYMLHDGES